MGGWLENWRIIPISAFNYVIVEVVAEIGKNIGQCWRTPVTLFDISTMTNVHPDNLPP